MWIFWTLVLSLALIPDCIELSSQSSIPSDDEADSSLPRKLSSDSAPERRSSIRTRPRVRIRQSSAASRTTARGQSSADRPPPADSLLRARSRSPPHTPICEKFLGFDIQDLRRIRLKPHNNHYTKIFELRNYTFPLEAPVRLQVRSHNLILLPTGPQIVLSTSNGDVFAFAEYRARKGWSFRALFKPSITETRSKRAMINVHTGEVMELTDAEAAAYPVVNHYGIRSFFEVYLANDRSSHS